MPIVQLQILQGRSEEKISGVIENVTNIISETLDTPKENIRVIVTEIPKTHWGRAGVPISKVQK